MNDEGPTNGSDALGDRYSRQVLFELVGPGGQKKLLQSRVALIGCGALGGMLASTLVRAGVGYLRIVDRDFIELSDLQRHVLFDEADLAENLPKAEAAKAKLSKINSTVTVEAEVADANHTNIEHLTEGVDLLLDGTDNFETRFLINDVAVKRKLPWVYGACLGASGLAMTILPNETPCLRCIFEHVPPAEMIPTCDTAGILAVVVNMVTSFQAIEAMKILMGRPDAINRHLVNIDAWNGRVTNVDVQAAYNEGNCRCCKQGKLEFLDGKLASTTTVLCGRDAVQIRAPTPRRVDFEQLAAKLRAVATTPPTFSSFMLRVGIKPYYIAVFADGRAIIKGTGKREEARAVYAKYIGS